MQSQRGQKSYSKGIADYTEDQLQTAVIHYLRVMYPGLLYFHTPNGGYRIKQQAKRFKAQGVLAGIPDVMILKARGEYHGFAAELKVGKNRPTERQKQVMKQMKLEGWSVVVAYSLDQFAEAFSLYMGDDNWKVAVML